MTNNKEYEELCKQLEDNKISFKQFSEESKKIKW